MGHETWGFIGLGQMGGYLPSIDGTPAAGLQSLRYSQETFEFLLKFSSGTGYPMAKKLRENMPSSHTLIILEVNSKLMNQFIEETKTEAEARGNSTDSIQVEIAHNAREVAERSVSPWRFMFPCPGIVLPTQIIYLTANDIYLLECAYYLSSIARNCQRRV